VNNNANSDKKYNLTDYIEYTHKHTRKATETLQVQVCGQRGWLWGGVEWEYFALTTTITGYSKITHLGYALQGTVKTPIAMMLRVIYACVCHLRHGRQQYAHGSAIIKYISINNLQKK